MWSRLTARSQWTSALASAAVLVALNAGTVSAGPQALLQATPMVASALPPAPVPRGVALPHPRQTRPTILPALYATFASLQVLDADSTRKAIRGGAAESNPFMMRASWNDPGMFALKAAATVGTIYFVERLWRHNRVAAVTTMIVLNSAYAAIVASNYHHTSVR